MLITSGDVTVDITVEEFERLGAEHVLKLFEAAKPEIINVVIKASIADDIYKGGTALNKAIEDRYGLSSSYGMVRNNKR